MCCTVPVPVPRASVAARSRWTVSVHIARPKGIPPNKCVLRAAGTGCQRVERVPFLLIMSALSEVQAYISNFWSGPNHTLPTRRLYPRFDTIAAGDIKRRAAIAVGWLVDGGMGKQQPYAFRLTKVTSVLQARANIGVLRVLQQSRAWSRDLVVVALLDRVKYRVLHGAAEESGRAWNVGVSLFVHHSPS